jgi:nucleoid-associated protein YgaU
MAMTFFRAVGALGSLLVFAGCGYIHFGRLPSPTAAVGDPTGYTDLLTEQKILKRELALARKEGDALRAALERGGTTSPDLAAQLGQATRELAALRADRAKLQTGNASPAQLSEIEEKLATSLRNYTQLQEENARLRTDLERARAENTLLTGQLKAAASENASAQNALAQLNSELIAQKEARARAEQATSAARAQLGAVVAARDAGPAAGPPAPAGAGTPLASSLQLAKAPPADSSAVAELRTTPERVRSAESTPLATPAPKPARKHIVQFGDTLEKIAEKYYGDPKGWVRIYTANNAKLRDAQALSPGTELEIPEN